MGERYGGTFPLGICLINVAGCFGLVLLSGLLPDTQRAALLTALLATGFVGGHCYWESR